ncbi:ATP-binding protein [Pantoea sp. USHLN256]|uniref:ATP-binding protein n=1 Tax=Pantoea sp. USHLN256 TaxID=3081293 RepID=UPI003016637D
MMQKLRTLLPTRMMSQLACLMILALLFANLAAVTATQFLGNLLSPAMRNIAVERLVLAYHESLSGGENFSLTRADGARFWLAAHPEVLGFSMREEEQRLRDSLMSQLALSHPASVTLQLESADGGLARRHIFSAARHQPLRLRATLALPDGRFFNSVQSVMPAYEWTQLLSFSLPIVSVPLLLLSLYFIYRVVRPIRRLATAAEAISRGEGSSTLPLSGPQESRELTQAFNLMQLRLARHLDSRTRMLAAMSHDLNTPMTELRLQVELMPDGDARDDMLESLNELRAMVSETLHFIRGDVQQELPQRCNLSQMLEELTRRYLSLGKRVRWQGEPHSELMCRPLAIKRALSNLIENALLYGGEAEVTLIHHPGWVWIEVLDQGAGLPTEQLAQACEPFVRFSETARADNTAGGGLGLGLAIAQSNIHAHGGELILANRPPAGLCATVMLPDGVRS